MGFPFSAAVVAKIVMQSIEERALATTTNEHYHFGFTRLTTPSLHYNKTTLRVSTTILTNRTVTYNLPKTSKRMEQFLS